MSACLMLNHGRESYPITSLQRGFLVLLVAENLDFCTYAEAVTHFVDAHFLKVGGIHLHEVGAIDIVAWKNVSEMWSSEGGTTYA